MENKIREVAGIIAGAETVLALTGAGISVESGIPAFRGTQGLWSKYDPMEYANIDSFRANPVKVWEMLRELDEMVLGAAPNRAHRALAELERMGKLTAVVTQNVDGLHQAAGSKAVIEFHGSNRMLRCLDCGRQMSRGEVLMDEMPPTCHCGGLVKPDMIFFGEPIPERAVMTSYALASACQVMLVAGTSAMVVPASQLPVLAKQAGAVIVEINPEPTPLSESVSDYVFNAGASEVLSALCRQLAPEAGQ